MKDWMPKNPYEEYTMEELSMQLQCEGYELGCKETARNIFVWLNSDCIEPHSEGFTRTHKDCKLCMQQFCKEVGL